MARRSFGVLLSGRRTSTALGDKRPKSRILAIRRSSELSSSPKVIKGQQCSGTASRPVSPAEIYIPLYYVVRGRCARRAGLLVNIAASQANLPSMVVRPQRITYCNSVPKHDIQMMEQSKRSSSGSRSGSTRPLQCRVSRAHCRFRLTNPNLKSSERPMRTRHHSRDNRIWTRQGRACRRLRS